MQHALAEPVYVKRSSVHGFGLFSKKRISRERFIGRYTGKPAREDDTYVLWIPNDDGGADGVDGKTVLKYLNHSSKPNAALYGDELFAIRDIDAHEEITIHYGREWRNVA